MYKRQRQILIHLLLLLRKKMIIINDAHLWLNTLKLVKMVCLLYTSDAADERSSVDLGGRRIIKKKITVTADVVYYT